MEALEKRVLEEATHCQNNNNNETQGLAFVSGAHRRLQRRGAKRMGGIT